jgi:hypothetical protein
MATQVRNYVTKQPSAIYGLAFLGALFYFLSHATTFWMGVLGVVKAIFWPGVVIYKLLDYWHM